MTDGAPPPETQAVEVVKVREGRRSRVKDLVVKEAICSILVNGTRVASLACTPSDLESLAVGLLVSEGIIASYSDVLCVSVKEDGRIVEVETHGRASDRITQPVLGRESVDRPRDRLMEFVRDRNIASKLAVPASSLAALVRDFQEASMLFRSTGGVHSAAVCEPGGILFFKDDIGRHNAVDKVLGECSIKGIRTDDKILLLTGRVCSSVLMKAFLRGMPVLVSQSAPTHLAVELAYESGMTLVGFARGESMNVYSHDWRIVD
ncbi:MAG: formate dehydrogenase accessory sulfurtransferase FdhD [Candidatus Brockarchaeota archaeon]|nr:formate dehydrogenase accessory sulfurtransferase FdhD [Candidatus Brockarchaeota archaeon]